MVSETWPAAFRREEGWLPLSTYEEDRDGRKCRSTNRSGSSSSEGTQPAGRARRFLAVVPFLPGEDRDGLSARMVWTSLIVAGLFQRASAAFFCGAPSSSRCPLIDRWFDLPGDAAVAPVLAAIFVFLVAAHILADIFLEIRSALTRSSAGSTSTS